MDLVWKLLAGFVLGYAIGNLARPHTGRVVYVNLDALRSRRERRGEDNTN